MMNKEDAMNRSRWRKFVKDGWRSGAVWAGECFFCYRFTTVVTSQYYNCLQILTRCSKINFPHNVYFRFFDTFKINDTAPSRNLFIERPSYHQDSALVTSYELVQCSCILYWSVNYSLHYYYCKNILHYFAPEEKHSTVISMCLSVYEHVRNYMSNLQRLFVLVIYGHGLVLLLQHCDTLCTFSFYRQ